MPLKKLIICSLLLLSVDLHAGEPAFEEKARIAIADYASALKSALTEAMQTGGPQKAVQVCHTEAPEIAAGLSQQHDLTISRTSLKPRNTANAPDEWERDVLQTFQKRHTNGESINSLVAKTETPTESGSQMRLMKAIPTGELCLTCHGENVAPELQSLIDKHYPNDKATGFSVGDIRGAFSVTER